MIGITKSEFENSLLREDVVEYYLNMSREDIEYKFGSIVLDMVGFNQNNPHHCYDLFEHTLRTVKDLPTGELSNEEIKLLKIAAFLHDVAKPNLREDLTGREKYIANEIESAKMARNFLQELGYRQEEIARICFYIAHVEDFVYYKDEVPYYYEHHLYIKKISSLTIAEQMLENEYNFRKLGLDSAQIKAICYSLVRDGEWPLFETEKGEEVKIAPVDMEDVKCKLVEIRRDYMPTLKDYQMLSKLSIANYKAQAKKSYQRGRLIATRAEKVRVAAIIESILPEAYKVFEEAMDKYQMDGALTQELIDVTNKYHELIAMNQIEQMREENAKNLMNKFNDMKIRLTMKS
ncbi:MAG: HD domain-containing protein [Clostridia bacterium]|nr:HD domain-containing protein [Clostridia bacterium]